MRKNVTLAEKLFTSKSRIRILELFFFRKNILGTREVSREPNTPVSAIQREIENLICVGILKKENGKIILNPSCSFIEDLKNILIKTDYAFIPVKKALNEDKINFAFIFGSFAKGDMNNSSDIDLMIVGNVSENNIFKKLKYAEKEIGREINPVIWTKEELVNKKNTSFFRDAIKKIIMINGDENELRKFIE